MHTFYMSQTIATIQGMHCEGCVALIKDISADFTAISSTDVDLATKTVKLEHNASFDRETWRKEIEEANPAYKVHFV